MEGKMNPQTSSANEEIAILEARNTIRARIEKQALSEGSPLTELEMRMLDSDRMDRDRARQAMDEVEKIYGWQEFMDRISGLLTHAIEHDTAADPTARGRFDGLVHRLESSKDDFTLWACCVPAISGYESEGGLVRNTVVITALLLLLIAVIVAKALKAF